MKRDFGRFIRIILLSAIVAMAPFAPGGAPHHAFADEDEMARMQEEIERVRREAADEAERLLREQGISGGDGAKGIDANALGKALQSAQGKRARRGAGGDDFGGPLYWFFMIFISIVGMGYFASGKRSGDIGFTLAGLVMMGYPYFVSDTLTLAGVGVLLTVGPFLLRLR